MFFKQPIRVFISYTAEDLKAHADVVAEGIRQLEWVPIDHRDWVVSGNPSVKECMEKVRGCHILILLVAHRYGWVPPISEGGDGKKSITQLEVEEAMANQLPIIPYLVDEEAEWPVNLIEGLKNPDILESLNGFKKELRKNISGFFSTPQSIHNKLTLSLLKAAGNLSPDTAATANIEQPEMKSMDEKKTNIKSIRTRKSRRTEKIQLLERLNSNLPKKILSIDGAGVRTAITLGYLERIENILKERFEDSSLRLCNYFDLIGGVGPSSLIAALLADGCSARQLIDIYRNKMPGFYDKNSIFKQFLSLYDKKSATNLVRSLIGDKTIMSPSHTGLCIIATRFDNRKIYPFISHPEAPMYNDYVEISLSDMILASMSLPTYFSPHLLNIGKEHSIPFIDGSMSIGRDPSMYLFLLSTGLAYPFKWRTGFNRLLLISLGSGISVDEDQDIKSLQRPNLLNAITNIPSILLQNITDQNLSLLQSLSGQRHNSMYASEKDYIKLVPEVTKSNALMTYKRFDVNLDANSMRAIGLPELTERLEGLKKLESNSPKVINDLISIGEHAAKLEIDEEDFPSSFDFTTTVV